MFNDIKTIAVDYTDVPKHKHDTSWESGVKLFREEGKFLIEAHVLSGSGLRNDNLKFSSREELEGYFEEKYLSYMVIEDKEFELVIVENGRYKIKAIKTS